MNETRSVAISHEQFDVIEEVGLELMRQGDYRASKLLAIALAWKHARPRGIVSKSARPRMFECDGIDESAGLAEVYAFEAPDEFSKRVS